MRYKITLSYNGTGFCGWQIQDESPSVQGAVQDAFRILLQTRSGIEITGAGRTDTGVSACNYVAHFNLDEHSCAAEVTDAVFLHKLNAILPKNIKIHSIEKVDDDFHARFGAKRREYTYFLHTTKDPFIGSSSYLCTFPLDFELMNKCAQKLIGTHDFSCFEKKGADNKTSVCTVFEAGWHRYTPTYADILHYSQEGSWWYFRISADRFLRNMVRAITGTLIEVGRGKRSEENFSSLVLPSTTQKQKGAGDRCKAGESVIGEALFLSEIDYLCEL